MPAPPEPVRVETVRVEIVQIDHPSNPSQVFLKEREFFSDSLLVRIHLIIEMTSVDRPCVMGV